jgi:hypothetical protein
LETHPEVKVIECHCDNEAGVLKVQRPELYPGEMIAADMDLVLAIRGVIARAHCQCQIFLKHVKGHVDRDRPRSEWTFIESINVACDEEAEKCVEMGITPLPFHPLPGDRCLLRVHDGWITTSPTVALQTYPAKEAISELIFCKMIF